jgi:hypothetical protein
MKSMMRVVFILFTSFFISFSGLAQQNCDPENRAETTNTGTSDYTPFRLLQNFPNPARDITTIKVQVNCPGTLSLKVYDLVGNLVYFSEERVQPGLYSLPVETANLPEGVYFYMVKRDTYSQTMKMIVSRK